MQGAYGLDVLKYSETVAAVARTSTPNEVLRGLGYWFFYGQDRLGSWIEAARDYTQHPYVILAGYGLAALALLAAAFMRWRHRVFFVLMLFVGVVTSVDVTLAAGLVSGAFVSGNDNWLFTDAPIMAAVGAFPITPFSRDAALVTTLLPGNYSVQVNGVGVS